jgi:multiple sugar transport system substrate-binding protein
VSADKGADIAQAAGSFPARTKVLESEKFLAEKDPYFGGQEVNRIFTSSLAAVHEGWQYLPYDVYAISIFNDKVGKAFTGSLTLQEGLNAWQKELVAYGSAQGFSMG